jgi:hypothetical protein
MRYERRARISSFWFQVSAFQPLIDHFQLSVFQRVSFLDEARRFLPQALLALRGFAHGLRNRWRVPVPNESSL